MTRPLKTRGLKARKQAPTPLEPKNERDLKFCERWLVHHDHLRAYAEAGFSTKSNDYRNAAIRKATRFRRYLESRLPRIEREVAKEISYERSDILRGIARIANANALDYITEAKIIDQVTGVMVTQFRMKKISELTRDQAAALDGVTYDAATGCISYTLPSAKTRLAAFTTMGEQAAGFSKPAGEVHNHLHLHDVPLDKLRHIKALLIDMVGTNAARQVFGMEYQDAETAPE